MNRHKEFVLIDCHCLDDLKQTQFFIIPKDRYIIDDTPTGREVFWKRGAFLKSEGHDQVQIGSANLASTVGKGLKEQVKTEAVKAGWQYKPCLYRNKSVFRYFLDSFKEGLLYLINITSIIKQSGRDDMKFIELFFKVWSSVLKLSPKEQNW